MSRKVSAPVRLMVWPRFFSYLLFGQCLERQGSAWGKGEVSPLVAAPGLFFLVSGNSAAAQTCIFHLSETNPSTRQSCSLQKTLYLSFVEFTVYAKKVIKLFSPKHAASSLSRVLVNTVFSILLHWMMFQCPRGFRASGGLALQGAAQLGCPLFQLQDKKSTQCPEPCCSLSYLMSP